MLIRLAATRRGALSWVFLLVGSVGCGSSSPTSVHGKPVEYWLQALHDSDVRIRLKAVESLGNVGADNPAAIPALIQALDDHEPRVRGAAVLALLKIGPDARDAVPALQKMVKDKDAKVRGYAAKALERIEGRD